MGYIGIYWDILKIFTIESYVNPSNLFVMSQSWNKWVESEFCRRNFAHLQASGPEHLHISREDFRDASQKNRKNKKKRDEKGIPEHLQDLTMTPMTCFPIFRDIWSISHIFPTFSHIFPTFFPLAMCRTRSRLSMETAVEKAKEMRRRGKDIRHRRGVKCCEHRRFPWDFHRFLMDFFHGRFQGTSIRGNFGAVNC